MQQLHNFIKSLYEFYSSQTTIATVETIVDDSKKRYFDANRRAYFIENRVEPISKYLKKDAKIIDIGCGDGTFVKYMLDNGFDAYGVDLSEISVLSGIKAFNLQGRLRTGDWTTLSDANYDLITAWTLVEHLKNPQEFFNVAHKKLNHNGKLLIECPIVDSLLYEHTKDGFFWIMPPYHITVPSLMGLKSALKDSGFMIVETIQMPRNWYFFDSVAKMLDIPSENYNSNEDVRKISLKIDEIFDKIALENNKSSSLQIICQKV